MGIQLEVQIIHAFGNSNSLEVDEKNYIKKKFIKNCKHTETQIS